MGRSSSAIHERFAPEHLVITLGPDGMLLSEGGRPMERIPTFAREVFDVSGAGDTVTGTYNFTYNVDWSLVEQIDTTSLNKMITSGMAVSNGLGNIFVVASSDNAFYLAVAGNINITQFGGNGSLVCGSINNVICIYVTREHIETLMRMPASQRESINMLTEFPMLTFNGNMESRRTSIQTVMQALENMDE